MKKNLVRIIRYVMAFILIIPASMSLNAAAEQFTIDDQHSYVQFSIQHLGFSTQTGKWYVNGTVLLDKDKPENSKVNATIKIANMVTGIPELDKHLKSKQFFDAEQFPEATFVSNKIDVLTKTTAKVHGILTLRGVTKPVTLDVTMNKVGKNQIADRMTAGFNASTMLKRSDFGMNSYLPDLGDDIKIDISAEAFLSPTPSPADANPKQ